MNEEPTINTVKWESIKPFVLQSISKFFGKAPAIDDNRTLDFAAICLNQDRLPEEYDFDEPFAARLFPGHKRKGIPTPKFGNEKSPNCVIAGRAHQTLRFELGERERLIKITTKDVMDEYRKETGGQGRNVEVLDSLKRWRKDGWNVA